MTPMAQRTYHSLLGTRKATLSPFSTPVLDSLEAMPSVTMSAMR